MSKNNIFALIALLVVLIIGAVLPRPVTTPVSNEVPQQNAGGVRTEVDQYPNGLTMGNPAIAQNWLSGVIARGQNQIAFQNRTGKDMYVDEVVAQTTGTASSTYRFLVGTSTASTIGNYTSPSSSNFSLINFAIATSSVATTTNNYTGSAASRGVVRVRDGEWVNAALLSGSTGAPLPSCDNGLCESATSTNRGISTIDVFLHYFTK